MKIKFRIDSVNDQHVCYTMFQDGGNCGQWTMQSDAFYKLESVLKEQKVFNFEIDGEIQRPA